ncbi:uncharacterized protein LOC104584454 [Brachypodium distachyon]|uniref:Knottin scorpion toxin-like domain-containing protein n=1 Tax=Brachypodium distachyon TaxID=15368 RepID=A0A2K2CM02_BRADI|nr:uncharacterized protein LOC104584454 [Brachypodium distachyon]PNT63049.1 hypothetical protein BRADI_4g10932v3 [Brachypodium distachyon]|eukprot:XP_010237452.1 uncharacterized protein LOC104584454 [Brachypodium distachyon]
MADTRRAAALCVLLPLLVLSLANPYPVEAGCRYTYPWMPFCKGWMCKAECWAEAKLDFASLKEHYCVKGGFKGYCYCMFCSKHLRDHDDEVQGEKPKELLH